MAGYEVFAPFYDALIAPVDYAARAAYFDALLRRRLPRRGLLLDLACGTGRLSIELSRLGWEVMGADASEPMLSMARQNVDAAGADIFFLHQRMEALHLPGPIDACVCALDSLNHLTTPARVQKTLARVARFLRPGGMFVFDMNTPYKHQTLLADRCYAFEAEGVFCVWQNDTKGDRTRVTLDFFARRPDGSYLRSGEEFIERAYPREWIEQTARDCGLAVRAVYGDDSRRAPGPCAERYIFVTQKEK